MVCQLDYVNEQGKPKVMQLLDHVDIYQLHETHDMANCSTLDDRAPILKMSERSTYYLADVVSPWQEEDTGVILLKVGYYETSHDTQQNVVCTEHVNAHLTAPKYGVERHRNEERAHAIQSVVEQLPEW